jgi:hypothetical protein
MKTAFVLISHGAKYHQYIAPLLQSMKDNLQFPYDVFLWTDLPIRPSGVMFHHFCPYAGFPAATLQRYHMFLQAEADLCRYDQIFYSDIDMRFVAPVRIEDIASEGITATLHPGFVVDRSHIKEWTGNYLPCRAGTPDRNPRCTAYIPHGTRNQYFCGGFNGGNAKAFLDMSRMIRANVDIDARNGIKALWNDESHLNNYLWKNPPSRILSPSFCYPEDYHGQWAWRPDAYRAVLMALDKSKR